MILYVALGLGENEELLVWTSLSFAKPFINNLSSAGVDISAVLADFPLSAYDLYKAPWKRMKRICICGHHDDTRVLVAAGDDDGDGRDVTLVLLNKLTVRLKSMDLDSSWSCEDLYIAAIETLSSLGVEWER